MKRRILITSVFCAVLHLLHTSVALSSQLKPNKAYGRQDQIGRELDCVEQNMGEDGVTWNEVCYVDRDVRWDEVDNYPPRDRYNSYYKSDRTFQQKKLLAVDMSLDSWENVERRHKNIDHGMEPVHKKKDMNMGKNIQPVLDDNYARENVRRKSKVHVFEGSWDVFGVKFTAEDYYKKNAVMNGFSGEYTYRPGTEDPFYSKAVNTYRLDGLFAWGDFDLEEERAEFDGLRVDERKSYMMELRGILGKEYVHDTYDFLAYTGFGYRYLKHKGWLSPPAYNGTSYIDGSDETRYYYVPIGIEFVRRLEGDWSMTVNGEYDWFIVGQHRTNSSEINKYFSPGFESEDVQYRQDNGYGMRGSIKFAKALDRLNIFVEPFFKYWNVSDGEPKTSFRGGEYDMTPRTETENITLEGGVKMGLQF